MADVGIDDEFIKKVRDDVTPGTSALFVMTADAVLDKVREAFGGHEGQLIHTNLSDQEGQASRSSSPEQRDDSTSARSSIRTSSRITMNGSLSSVV
jgi:uncharacterized membrane protein